MCLDKLEKFKVSKNIGYVVVRPVYQVNCSDGEVLPVHYSSLFWYFIKYELGVTYTAYNVEVIISSRKLEQYTSGFHIFLRKKDVIKYNCNSGSDNTTIMKCKFSKVLAKGLQNGMKCIVANERTLLKEVKE